MPRDSDKKPKRSRQRKDSDKEFIDDSEVRSKRSRRNRDSDDDSVDDSNKEESKRPRRKREMVENYANDSDEEGSDVGSNERRKKRLHSSSHSKSARTGKKGKESFYYVERIDNTRTLPNGTVEFLVKWEGWPEESSTWEPEDNLTDCAKALRTFYEKRSKCSASPNKSTPLKASSSFSKSADNDAIVIDGDSDEKTPRRRTSEEKLRKRFWELGQKTERETADNPIVISDDEDVSECETSLGEFWVRVYLPQSVLRKWSSAVYFVCFRRVTFAVLSNAKR